MVLMRLALLAALAAVAIFIYSLVPEFLMRFLAWLLIHSMYSVKKSGLDHIPEEGPCIVVCNHVSYVDAIVLAACVRRPIRFVMDHRIFKIPVMGWFFKLAKAIPIAPKAEDETAYNAAFEAAHQVLREGDLLAIFPEGGITKDGELQTFKGGITKILDRAQSDGLQADAMGVPTVPMALTHLWGSFFSRLGGDAMTKPFRRGLWSRVGLNVGEVVRGEDALPHNLHAQVKRLLTKNPS